MKVILLQDIPKVGNRYDVKDLKEGYAQNVLISKGLAILATPQAMANLDHKKEQMNKKKEEEMQVFDSLIASVNNKVIKLKAKANDKGHLFKSVNARDVVSAIKSESGVIIDESNIIMDHIKEVGEHTVAIKKGSKQGKCQIIVEKE